MEHDSWNGKKNSLITNHWRWILSPRSLRSQSFLPFVAHLVPTTQHSIVRPRSLCIRRNKSGGRYEFIISLRYVWVTGALLAYRESRGPSSSKLPHCTPTRDVFRAMPKSLVMALLSCTPKPLVDAVSGIRGSAHIWGNVADDECTWLTGECLRASFNAPWGDAPWCYFAYASKTCYCVSSTLLYWWVKMIFSIIVLMACKLL